MAKSELYVGILAGFLDPVASDDLVEEKKIERPRNGLLTFVLYIPVSKHCAPHSSYGLSLR